MLTLRPYQEDALSGIFNWLRDRNDNGLVVLPTGTGKSLVIAALCKTCHEWDPKVRIVMLTHVRELVAQNFAELITHWPNAPAGINSASLGKRQVKQITFASIQSVYKHAERFQRVDIVLVDEAHLIPKDGNAMYRQFLADLKVMNPYIRVIGLTATPYRLDSGRLDDGEDALFGGVAYEYPIAEAIREGYLTRLVTKSTGIKLDTTGVGMLGGDFKPGALEKAVDIAEVNDSIVQEAIVRGQDRQGWLFFCSGVDHAQHIAELVNGHGYPCGVIHAGTDKTERTHIIADFKARRLRALASMNVLTTGFNAPHVDLLAMLRPTKSRGLYIQIAGRGTRNVYAPGHDLSTTEGRLAAIAGGSKPDCLVLDFARNIERHGPIDIEPLDKPKEPGSGEAPIKECPACGEYVHAAVRVCEHCGHEFPEPEVKVERFSSKEAILSEAIRPEWVTVTGMRLDLHEKPGSPPSMRVTYACGLTEHREWICFEHEGYARQKAVGWWKRNANGDAPETVEEAFERAAELVRPDEIRIRKAGKYTEIVGTRALPGVQPGGAMVGDTAPNAARRQWLDDVVPF